MRQNPYSGGYVTPLGQAFGNLAKSLFTPQSSFEKRQNQAAQAEKALAEAEQVRAQVRAAQKKVTDQDRAAGLFGDAITSALGPRGTGAEMPRPMVAPGPAPTGRTPTGQRLYDGEYIPTFVPTTDPDLLAFNENNEIPQDNSMVGPMPEAMRNPTYNEVMQGLGPMMAQYARLSPETMGASFNNLFGTMGMAAPESSDDELMRAAMTLSGGKPFKPTESVSMAGREDAQAHNEALEEVKFRIAQQQRAASEAVASTGAGAQIKVAQLTGKARLDSAKEAAVAAVEVAKQNGASKEVAAKYAYDAAVKVAEQNGASKEEAAKIGAEASQAVAKIGATSAQNVATTRANADKFISGNTLTGTKYGADQRRASVEDTNIANLMSRASEVGLERERLNLERDQLTEKLASAEKIAEIGKRPGRQTVGVKDLEALNNAIYSALGIKTDQQIDEGGEIIGAISNKAVELITGPRQVAPSIAIYEAIRELGVNVDAPDLGLFGGTDIERAQTTGPVRPTAPTRPANVPMGSAFSASKQMWRAPNGTLYKADGTPVP